MKWLMAQLTRDPKAGLSNALVQLHVLLGLYEAIESVELERRTLPGGVTDITVNKYVTALSEVRATIPFTNVVRARRPRHRGKNISWRKVNWSKPMMKIAEELGCTLSTVEKAYKRIHRGWTNG